LGWNLFLKVGCRTHEFSLMLLLLYSMVLFGADVGLTMSVCVCLSARVLAWTSTHYAPCLRWSGQEGNLVIFLTKRRQPVRLPRVVQLISMIKWLISHFGVNSTPTGVRPHEPLLILSLKHRPSSARPVFRTEWRRRGLRRRRFVGRLRREATDGAASAPARPLSAVGDCRWVPMSALLSLLAQADGQKDVFTSSGS
jgi:hypothetical protein